MNNKDKLIIGHSPSDIKTYGPVAHKKYEKYIVKCLHDPQIFIEICSMCNFKCDYCLVPQMKRDKIYMDRKMFSRLIDQVAEMTSRNVNLHLANEPTLHPEFLEMALEVNQKGLGISLVTNGSRLTRDYLKVKMHVLVTVSTNKSQLKQRSTMNYDAYIDRLISYVRDWKETKSTQRIAYSIYLYRDELKKAHVIKKKSDFVDWLLEKAGLPNYKGKGFFSDFMLNKCGPYNTRQEVIRFSNENGGLFKIEARPLKPIYRFPASKVEIPYEVNRKWPEGYGFCESPWKMLVVLADGRIAFCCTDLSGGTAFTKKEEIHEKSLKDIWFNNDRIKYIREQMLDGKIVPGICRKCMAQVPHFGRYIDISWKKFADYLKDKDRRVR